MLQGMARLLLATLGLSVMLILSGCSNPAELEVTGLQTGWLDVGLDELGQNKLVPVVSFRLKNVGLDSDRTVQVTGVFRRCEVIYEGQDPPENPTSPANVETGTCIGEDREWGSTLIRGAIGREGLEPGAEAGPFTMENKLGYTGLQPQAEMLGHRDFVNVKVELFMKHLSDQWAPLNEFPVDRQLLTQ
jgi:hypothetical protein